MRIAFIGMGEAGSALVAGWGDAPPGPIKAYDIKTDDPDTAPDIANRCAELGVTNCMTLGDALHEVDLVFCTVTADQAVVAANAGATALGQGTVWLDLNSCAPSSKRLSAEVIERSGGRYVDVAVMSPVHPKLNMVPLLVSGPHAADIATVLEALPMAPRVIDGPVGAASSIKMIRSIMVKGLEALTAECVLAAVAAGVEDEVLGSLMRSHPGTDWPTAAAYNFERAMVHGARRAAEMEEVAKTISDLGLSPDMTDGTIAWQRRMAGLCLPDKATVATHLDFAEALLPHVRTTAN